MPPQDTPATRDLPTRRSPGQPELSDDGEYRTGDVMNPDLIPQHGVLFHLTAEAGPTS